MNTESSLVDMRPSSRVLLVEDNEDAAEMMIMLLENAGYTVAWAENGGRAMTLLLDAFGRNEPPAVILLDLTLPDLDGAEMANRLAEAGRGLPPVIVLSAKTPGALADAARALKAVGFLRKPFHIEELLNQIAQVVEPKPIGRRL
jgi:CheY-like chemotaxis protein